MDGPADLPADLAEKAPGERALDFLRRSIEEGHFPGGARLPAEQSLADEIGVSRGTVRGALDKLEREGLVKSSRGRGRVVVRGSGPRRTLMSHSIALLTNLPSNAERFRQTGWMEAVDTGAGDAAGEAGYHVLTLNPDGLADEGVRRLLADPPKGVVVAHVVGENAWGPPIMAELRRRGVPFVVNGDAPELASCDRVVSDHEAGARSLTKWLIGKGRKRIIRVWTADPEGYWTRARDAGHERAMREAGLEPLAAVIVRGTWGHLAGVDGRSTSAGQEGTPRLPVNLRPQGVPIDSCREAFDVQVRQFAGYLVDHLNGRRPVDAILATTDSEAFAVASACRLFGKEPNADVDVVGYDNVWRECPERAFEEARPLATVDKLNHETGRRMVRLLLDRIAGRLPEAPQRVLVEPELVVTTEG